MAEKLTETRRRLNTQIDEHRGSTRELVFLDLALEDFLRVVVERNLHLDLTGDALVALIGMVLENLLITKDNEELRHCYNQWERLRRMSPFGRSWSLEANAVLDRLSRAMQAMADDSYRILQPKAEFLGNAFHADEWAISLFSEEVMRGSPFFVLSMLLLQIDPILRKGACLGDWQVVSPGLGTGRGARSGTGLGTGRVHVVKTLKSIQGKVFPDRVVIVADRISGEEEIPQEVVGIITADRTDVLSHVAIRARNSRVLFATCYDEKTMGKLKSLKGRWLQVRTSSAGDVVFQEGSDGSDRSPGGEGEGLEMSPQRPQAPISPPEFVDYAVSAHSFNERNVGGKSNNLKRLQGKLPEWINFPTSVALPFGVFEKVLAQDSNKEVASRCEALGQQADKPGEESLEEVLCALREAVLDLEAPKELLLVVKKAMEEAGLLFPADGEDVWRCIKQVWASKWNERAYLSRRATGIAHEDLFMAVLIQEVVDADFSFVIHTTNPLTENQTEIYAEVVPGLGETLVGNYPGKALGFTCGKGKDELELVSFPSKSIGLFGRGLIFRSDSNGEDLAGFAGAGLYESVMLDPPEAVSLDYTKMSFVEDEDFRKDLLVNIAAVGVMVESALGSPQDIEGAYSKGKYYVVQTRPQVGIGA
jgi:alpha-glucan,water dikinase